ncbi:Uncharacterized alpha/beta hydrolase domain (DUF2235) domain containing protein [Lactarius tabidus]
MSNHKEVTPAFQNHESDNLKCYCKDYKSNGRRRRLVVAFDGTQNQFGPESSHVVEFYSRIVKSGDQLSYYTSGIGSFVKPSSYMRNMRMGIKNKCAAALGLNFKSNLLSGYRFLSDKYERGDQIFLLGFSRGAYQARVLAAMITKVGLLRTGNNEQIPFAFQMYKDPEASKDEPIDSRNPEGKQTNTANEFKKAFCYDVNIHFVGVWDTISSVGVFRNKYYPGAELAEKICFFRHALALDERRVKFIPECKEVWFRGSHSDIGGGNVKNRTSENGAIPSRWMAYEAMLAGLEMTPFCGGITVKDLEPKIRKESMKRLYKLLEIVPFIKWEDHSKGRPPLLELEEGRCRPPRRTSKEPRAPRDFSRACHRKRPRQIYDHQKLHSSVCLHDGLSKNKIPFAHLPKSWINEYGWIRVLDLLRDKEDNIKAKVIDRFDNIKDSAQVHAPVNPQTPLTPWQVLRLQSVTITPLGMQELRNTILKDPPDADMFPPEAIESDLLDCDVIPALIASVLRGTNVNEFLERLGVLACLVNGVREIREDSQFSSMLQQVYSDEKYAQYPDLAMRVTYQVFWHSEIDLYTSDEGLWRAVLSWVEKWNRSRTDDPMVSTSLHMAVRLLHKTNSDKAFFLIKYAIIEIFNQWQRTFTEHFSALLRLHFLLTTAADCNLNVPGYVL